MSLGLTTTSLKRRIPVTTILIAIMAVSAGVAISPYLLSLNTQRQEIATTSDTSSPFTSTPNTYGLTSSSLLYSSSTSTTSQRQKWLSSNANVISWTQASSYVGQSKIVEGKIVYTYVSKGTVFLDFRYPYQGYFYAVIFSSDVNKFSFPPASFYLNKEVRVSGLIQLYQGSSEIIVRSPSQIEVAYMGFNYP